MAEAYSDPLRLLIVAADPLVRAGLASLLNDQPLAADRYCQVVAQVDGRELDSDIALYQPDAILWDLGWEAEESLVSLEETAAGQPDRLPIVALLPDIEQAGAAWAAGVRGLLLRDSAPEQLLAAIATVLQGLAAVDPELLDQLLPAGREGPLPLDGTAVEPLTPRERQVLQLMAEGLANRAIAQALQISEHTVKFHVNTIMGKLGAQSRTAAVVQATRLGLLSL
jgi:two-component system, NarL family, nitrate/nitrite response regulator NarL